MSHLSIYKLIKNFRRLAGRVLILIVLTVIAIGFLFPMFFTISNSFMNEGEIVESYKIQGSEQMLNKKAFYNIKFIPDQATIEQYYCVLLKNNQYVLMFWNSLILVLPIIIGQIVVASSAAYAFTIIKYRWKEALFLAYIIVMLMPYQVTLVPNYIIAEKLNLVGSYWSVIFPGIFNTFGVFLLRQHMEQIPCEYIEAAKIDGANYSYIFLNCIIPMCKTAVAALIILTFIDNWNMVEQPLIFLKNAGKEPLSTYLTRINEGEKGIAFAASVIYMLPMLLTFLYGESYFVEGIQLSGIKC